jgi:hypothetical protein
VKRVRQFDEHWFVSCRDFDLSVGEFDHIAKRSTKTIRVHWRNNKLLPDFSFDLNCAFILFFLAFFFFYLKIISP